MYVVFVSIKNYFIEVLNAKGQDNCQYKLHDKFRSVCPRVSYVVEWLLDNGSHSSL